MCGHQSSSPVTSITRGPRQTNMELCRIVAMALVLVTHASLCAEQDLTSSGTEGISSVSSIWMASASRSCVNLFVLISGWFGIRMSLRGFCNLIWQVLYFGIGIYVVLAACGLQPPSVKGLAYALLLGAGNLWFVKAYLALYILAPALNAFVDHAPRRTLGMAIMALYAFLMYFGLSGATYFIADGYSVFPFIALYLGARYLRVYEPLKHWSTSSLWLITIGSICLLALLCLICHTKGWNGIEVRLLTYISPLVLVTSYALMLAFTRLKMGYSPVINWLAASAFAVYLVQCNHSIYSPYFLPAIEYIRSQYDFFASAGLITALLIGMYIGSVILDQPRRWIWRLANGRYFRGRQSV